MAEAKGQAVAGKPDELARGKVTERQARYLADASGLDPATFHGQPIATVATLVGDRIDPILLLFRKVCGRVVKRDASGALHGVPGASVHVMDTDCSFLGFAPVESPWWWLWPVFCHREEVASARTDACGNFCVWVPRWDIDRILRFRRERVCYPDLYRLSLRDLLTNVERLRPAPPFPPNPNPPDPPVLDLRDRDVVEQLTDLAGTGVTDRLRSVTTLREWGSRTAGFETLLDEPAFVSPPRPALAAEHLDRLDLHVEASPKLQTDNLDLRDLVGGRPPLGPFFRCRDVWLPEWQTIFDVPDITFRVTQDVDFDGDEEVIYDEGFFDVRWNVDPIPSPTLVAEPWALAPDTCEAPDFPCTNTPALRAVGLMPIDPAYHDATTGFGLRVNRPRSMPGLYSDPQGGTSQAPYAQALQLYGCPDIPNAKYYRVCHREGVASYVPFLNSWLAPTLVGPPKWVHPDASGWYPIDADLLNPHWLLNWPTGPAGLSIVKLEVADNAKALLAASPEVGFFIDNGGPDLRISQIRWREVGGAWLPVNVFSFPFSCPVLHRIRGTSVEIEVTWSASADHLRDAALSAAGCGGGAPVLSSGADSVGHWYTDPSDNAFGGVATYVLAGSALPGCYTWAVDGWTRAFNPAGDVDGPGASWFNNDPRVYGHVGVAVSVVDV